MNGDDRRQTLISATVEVMLEKGFARATTRDVAARLGIGRGLIHHYFDSWDALQHAAFAAVADHAQQDAEEALKDLQGRPALDALLAMMVADPGDAHWRLVADAWDDAQSDATLARIQCGISQWWREQLRERLGGLGLDRTAAHDAAWRLMALADGLSANVLLAESEIDRSDAVRLLQTSATIELAASHQHR